MIGNVDNCPIYVKRKLYNSLSETAGTLIVDKYTNKMH